MEITSVKFSAFADLHHYPSVFKSDAMRRLELIQQRAEVEQVDFVVELGDFCHSPERHLDIIEKFNKFRIPSYHVLGNHDTDGTSYAETLRLYDMPGGYYYFDVNYFRFVVIDPNYYFNRGVYKHFEYRNYFDFPESRDHVPPEQLEWLRDTVVKSPYPCILLSHESFEREANGVRNADAVHEIIREAADTPGRVMLCINGHYHRDALRIIDNVAYLDLNSATMDWLNNPHDFFEDDIRAEFDLIDHTVIYNDPVHAVITLQNDGWLKIEGMTSSMFMGITREMTNNVRCDLAGRPAVPRVLSAKVKLW